EVHAFDDAAVLHIQTRYDADFQHYFRPILASAVTLNSARPVAASAGTAVVFANASASYRCVSASSSLGAVQRETCARNALTLAKCTGGRSLRMAPSALPPSSTSARTRSRR